MNRRELVKQKSHEWGFSRSKTRRIVDRFFDSIGTLLEREGRIELRGFGVFELDERAPTKGRIPGTGKEVEVPERTIPTFSAGKYLKQAVKDDS